MKKMSLKKAVSVILVMLVTMSCISALAEDTDNTSEEPEWGMSISQVKTTQGEENHSIVDIITFIETENTREEQIMHYMQDEGFLYNRLSESYFKSTGTYVFWGTEATSPMNLVTIVCKDKVLSSANVDCDASGEIFSICFKMFSEKYGEPTRAADDAFLWMASDRCVWMLNPSVTEQPNKIENAASGETDFGIQVNYIQ